MYWWQSAHCALPVKCCMYCCRVVCPIGRLVGGGGIGLPATSAGGGWICSQRSCCRTMRPRSVGDGSDVCAWMDSTLPCVSRPMRGADDVPTGIFVNEVEPDVPGTPEL